MSKFDKESEAEINHQMESELKSSDIPFSSSAINSLFHLKGEEEITEEVNLKNQTAYIEGVSDVDVFTVAKTKDDDETS